MIYGEKSCCATQISVPIAWYAGCLEIKLENETLQRLANLSKTTNILIASCDGFIRPFRAHPFETWSPERVQARNLAPTGR
jgi:hypothetical protein